MFSQCKGDTARAHAETDSHFDMKENGIWSVFYPKCLCDRVCHSEEGRQLPCLSLLLTGSEILRYPCLKNEKKNIVFSSVLWSNAAQIWTVIPQQSAAARIRAPRTKGDQRYLKVDSRYFRRLFLNTVGVILNWRHFILILWWWSEWFDTESSCRLKVLNIFHVQLL